MSESDRYLVIAKIVGFYGLQGWMKVKSFAESAENIMNYRDCFVEKEGAFQPIAIEQFKMQGKSVLLKISGVDDRTAAEAFGKMEIAVPISSLPDLDVDEYYWHQLTGLKVNTEDGCLGEVSHLLETGSNDVLVVTACKGSIDNRERLLPYRPEVILRVDLSAGVMLVDWDSEF